jgi:hypothetical protein
MQQAIGGKRSMYSTILPDSIKFTITTDPSEVNERKDMVYFQIVIKIDI